MMPKAILKPHDDKWQVVIVDTDLECIYTEPLSFLAAQRIANEYQSENHHSAVDASSTEGMTIFHRSTQLSTSSQPEN